MFNSESEKWANRAFKLSGQKFYSDKLANNLRDGSMKGEAEYLGQLHTDL